MPRVIPAARNADELREQLTDRSIMKDLLQDPEALADHVEASIQARDTKGDGVFAAEQVKAQTEGFMREWLKNQQGNTDELAARLNLGNAYSRTGPRSYTVYNKRSVGAKFDDLFNGDMSASDFFTAISDKGFKTQELAAKLDKLDMRNDLSSVKPSDGGFLIPERLRADLLRVALERAVVRPRARLVPMDSLTVPFPAVDSTSNVSSIYGGVAGFWTEEGATLTESQPRFTRVELKANKLALYTEVPNELFSDSIISLQAFLADVFPEAIAWFEDIAFFVGGGVGEPLGFLNAPARIQITRDAGGTPFEWIDVVNMYCRMLPSSLDRAVWIVSPDILPSLLTMTFDTGSGTGTSPVMLAYGGGVASGAGSPMLTMLGRPIIVSEKARAAGTAGDVTFTDFGYYLLGDRQAMSARQSEDFRFQNDITAFRVIERVDGRPWLRSPITPQNGSSNTLSPFVQLL